MDPATIASAIGGASGGIASALANTAGAYMSLTGQREANATNKNIAIMNLLAQDEWNKRNLGFQREAFDYQKALNEEIMNREDTAYQRTVEDMRKAGLNPLTMSGTNGSGGTMQAPEPLHGEAPLINYEEKNAMQAFERLNIAKDVIDAMASFQNMQIQSEKLKQEKNNTEWAEFITPYDKLYEAMNMYDTRKSFYHDYNFGFFSSMPDWEKTRRYIEYVNTKNKEDYVDKYTISDITNDAVLRKAMKDFVMYDENGSLDFQYPNPQFEEEANKAITGEIISAIKDFAEIGTKYGQMRGSWRNKR